MKEFADWTQRNTIALGVAFVVLMGLAIAADLAVVLGLSEPSISWRTWQAERKHPTLITAGTLATILVCYLVRGSWPLVFFAAFMGGHLFAHW